MKDQIKPSLIISTLSLLVAFGVFLFGNNILNKNKNEVKVDKMESVEKQQSDYNHDDLPIEEMSIDQIRDNLGIERNNVGLPSSWYLPEEVTFHSLENKKIAILDQNIHIRGFSGTILIGGVNRSLLSIGGRNSAGDDLAYALFKKGSGIRIDGGKEPYYVELKYKDKYIAIDVTSIKEMEMTVNLKSIEAATIVLKKWEDFKKEN